MTPDEEKDLNETIGRLIEHSNDPDRLRTSLSAALRMYYSMGHRSGYKEGWSDSNRGVDKRVVAHLN